MYLVLSPSLSKCSLTLRGKFPDQNYLSSKAIGSHCVRLSFSLFSKLSKTPFSNELKF